MANINVTKSDGRVVPLDYDKIHAVLERVTHDLTGVSISDIELNARLRFYDNIPTKEITDILIKSIVDLIDQNNPNYEIAASNLINDSLRSGVFGAYITPHLHKVIETNIERRAYDPLLLDQYTADEIDELNSYIDHDRDYLFKAAGIQQCIDKYLLKDRQTNQIFETPQYMYMCIAMTLFSKYHEYYDKQTRLDYVKRYYDAISRFYINLPTPVLSGARTPTRQYSSCVLVDFDDTMDSIIHSDAIVKKYTSERAGIGVNVGRIRAINSKVKDGATLSTGLIPFLKTIEASVRCCTQNGVRGGSATAYFPFWHKEIEDLVVLKNNKGSDDNRVRKLDYGVQLNKVFYKRVQENKDITLFSPHQVPELYESFGSDDFESKYLEAESNVALDTSKVNARELFADIIRERIETGRIYIMNIDHCNTHSSFNIPITMSNLCAEITLPTIPVQSFDDPNGEIALCVLSAINLGKIDLESMEDQLQEYCELAVRALEEVISVQEYPVKAAHTSTKKRRSLGIGYIGLAHFLAKHEIYYNSKKAVQTVDRLTECFQYNLIKASMELSKIKGPCEGFGDTKYSQGILPIDTYSKNVDTLCDRELSMDWEGLRSEVLKHGMRNSTLSAQMPSESSSVTSNETNGIEPPRAVVTAKKSKKGKLKLIVPEYKKYKKYYTFAWDPDFENKSYMNILAVIQKYFDQAISANEYFVPANYPKNVLPVKEVMRNLMYGYTMGLKTAYYLNTDDGKGEEEEPDTGCEGGGCSI